MLRPLVLFALLAPPATADTVVSDAFGILPSASLEPERAAWAGLRDGAAPVTVQAAQTETVLVFIGPKAISAGQDDGHAVALAFDPHGNLAQNETATFVLENNGKHIARLQDGIADLQFRPDPKAGTFSGGASVGNIQSPRALFRVTADLQSVSPEFSEAPSLRTEMFTTMTSTPLRDRYGNEVEDGVGTTILLMHDDGEVSFLPAQVRAEAAQTTILARDLETGGTATLNLASASGAERFELQRQEMETPPPLLIWDMEDIGAVGLRLGPVTTTQGHLLTDGAPVEIALTGEDGSRVETNGWLLDGYFHAIVGRPSAGNVLTATYRTAIGADTVRVTISEMPPRIIRGVE